eukprot:RCo052589
MMPGAARVSFLRASDCFCVFRIICFARFSSGETPLFCHCFCSAFFFLFSAPSVPPPRSSLMLTLRRNGSLVSVTFLRLFFLSRQHSCPSERAVAKRTLTPLWDLVLCAYMFVCLLPVEFPKMRRACASHFSAV